MKNTKRALRRHHRQRLYRRVFRYLRERLDDGDEWLRQCALRQLNNRQSCSCWLCGNPRRYTGKRPRQEQRQHEAAGVGEGQVLPRTWTVLRASGRSARYLSRYHYQADPVEHRFPEVSCCAEVAVVTSELGKGRAR